MLKKIERIKWSGRTPPCKCQMCNNSAEMLVVIGIFHLPMCIKCALRPAYEILKDLEVNNGRHA